MKCVALTHLFSKQASSTSTQAYSRGCNFTEESSTIKWLNQALTPFPISGSSSQGIILVNANLTGADLSHSDLSGSADLTNADLCFTNLYNALMQDANLTGANLWHSNVEDTNLTGADLTGANLSDVIWIRAICPDGTNSSDHDNTCEGHLSP